MLNNFGDIRNDILVELGASTTLAYYSETILNTWINKAHSWAAGVHKWPFTEGRVSTTWASGVINEDGDYRFDYPEGWKSDSIRLLKIGGYRVDKLNHDDYQNFREVDSNSNRSHRVFTDYGRIYLVNPLIDVSGTVTAWGQYTPLDIDTTDLTAPTIFSAEMQGNEALVEKVLSYAMTREKKEGEAKAHADKSVAILEGIWQKIQQEQYAYQTKNRNMYKRFSVIGGQYRDEMNSINQF